MSFFGGDGAEDNGGQAASGDGGDDAMSGFCFFGGEADDTAKTEHEATSDEMGTMEPETVAIPAMQEPAPVFQCQEQEPRPPTATPVTPRQRAQSISTEERPAAPPPPTFVVPAPPQAMPAGGAAACPAAPAPVVVPEFPMADLLAELPAWKNSSLATLSSMDKMVLLQQKKSADFFERASRVSGILDAVDTKTAELSMDLIVKTHDVLMLNAPSTQRRVENLLETLTVVPESA
eukprot:gene4566-830_t